MRPSIVAILLVLGPGLLLRAGEGRAESVGLTPTQVHLSKDTPTALLTVRNDGKGTARFQLSASAWSQNEKGEMVLTPTKDVVFFPTFVVAPPGTEKKVRVATSASFGAVERTYRLTLEELPPTETEAVPGQVAVLTRISVPVFVQPEKPAPKGALLVTAKKGAIAIVLRNEGNSYVTPSKIAVQFVAGKDTPARERTLDGWYLLAGGSRRYDVQPSPEECKGATSIVVSATFAGETLTRNVDAAAACGR
jgi:fimbrial chaperone protein